MKSWMVWFTLAYTLGATVAFASEDDVRSAWLRGDWKRAEAQLDRAETRAAGDSGAELAVMRDRVLLLIDLNSYSRYQPEATRAAVEQFYDRAADASDAAIKADAIHSMGRHRYWQMFAGQGDWNTVATLFKRALELRETTGDTSAIADSHFYLGLVHQMQDEAGPARAAFERGSAIAGDDPLMQSYFERHLGALDADEGKPELAHRRYVASVDLRRRAGATLLLPFALNLLASSEEKLKGAENAAELYRESARIAKQSASNRALADAEGELSRLAQSRGDQRAARRHAANALKAARAHGDPDLVKTALDRQSKL